VRNSSAQLQTSSTIIILLRR